MLSWVSPFNSGMDVRRERSAVARRNSGMDVRHDGLLLPAVTQVWM